MLLLKSLRQLTSFGNVKDLDYFLRLCWIFLSLTPALLVLQCPCLAPMTSAEILLIFIKVWACMYIHRFPPRKKSFSQHATKARNWKLNCFLLQVAQQLMLGLQFQNAWKIKTITLCTSSEWSCLNQDQISSQAVINIGWTVLRLRDSNKRKWAWIFVRFFLFVLFWFGLCLFCGGFYF